MPPTDKHGATHDTSRQNQFRSMLRVSFFPADFLSTSFPIHLVPERIS
jgi:hypothetical protein